MLQLNNLIKTGSYGLIQTLLAAKLLFCEDKNEWRTAKDPSARTDAKHLIENKLSDVEFKNSSTNYLFKHTIIKPMNGPFIHPRRSP